MKKYLSAILVFDVLLPALLLGLPGCILLWALISFQGFADSKTAEFSAYQDRVRFVEALNRELQPNCRAWRTVCLSIPRPSSATISRTSSEPSRSVFSIITETWLAFASKELSTSSANADPRVLYPESRVA